MAKLRIKKGDLVQVITRVRGRKNEDGTKTSDLGKQGKVLEVNAETQRVLVEGVNRVKRHTKARPGVEGGIVEREAPIHISNVQLVDPETGKPTRVGIREEKVERDGRTKTNRIRVAKRSGKDI
ncbi:50S ribosomal protein L24 [Kineococcus sp. LSe6-4]|uniref:Large ribosomal subunit protein uL24 n=1 Tax=Kineococcus halophytocola TaxID=3234027 RepID=A0ABV4H3N6_9ACTN